MTKKILMVCMGNICRSPMAEAIMRRALRREGADKEWIVDSAALVGYHTGSLPEERALNVLQNHGISYDKKARSIRDEDFWECEYIFGMDHGNVAELKRVAPQDNKARIMLLGDFGLEQVDKVIHDPYYYVGEAPFEEVYKQCVVACDAFIQSIVLRKQYEDNL